jgi:hypothetical protein
MATEEYLKRHCAAVMNPIEKQKRYLAKLTKKLPEEYCVTEKIV